MAKSPKQSETKVTRITASDSTATVSKKKNASTARSKSDVKVVKKTVVAPEDAPSRRISLGNPFAPIWRYLKGSWYELRQVRWPDRRETWKMTGALLLFTLFFVIVILLIDAGFGELFKLIIGK